MSLFLVKVVGRCLHATQASKDKSSGIPEPEATQNIANER